MSHTHLQSGNIGPVTDLNITMPAVIPAGATLVVLVVAAEGGDGRTGVAPTIDGGTFVFASKSEEEDYCGNIFVPANNFFQSADFRYSNTSFRLDPIKFIIREFADIQLSSFQYLLYSFVSYIIIY